jgi:hypothetical protein
VENKIYPKVRNMWCIHAGAYLIIDCFFGWSLFFAQNSFGKCLGKKKAEKKKKRGRTSQPS